MQFNDLLENQSIDPETVLVLRHRPSEPKLREVFPWLAAERPELFNAYQRIQTLKVEKSMMRASYVASFIGHESGKGLFVGLYRRGRWRPLSYEAYWRMRSSKDLRKFGHGGFAGEREAIQWFNLRLTDCYSDWKGRLVVNWPPPERSWWRWAGRNQFAVHAIHEESLLDPPMPEWDKLDLTWNQLDVRPSNLQAALRQWRGIYYIFDEENKKGYVGAAFGQDNILGRWLNYAKSGHGGNKKLRKRDPSKFRFTILQRVSPDMESQDVQRLEASWKDRLHTREFGMNEN
jgi:hypothetical protein